MKISYAGQGSVKIRRTTSSEEAKPLMLGRADGAALSREVCREHSSRATDLSAITAPGAFHGASYSKCNTLSEQHSITILVLHLLGICRKQQSVRPTCTILIVIT